MVPSKTNFSNILVQRETYQEKKGTLDVNHQKSIFKDK